MDNLFLTYPLLILVTSVFIALLFGLPTLKNKISVNKQAWFLALFPFTALILSLLPLPALNAGQVFIWRIAWLPSLGIELGLYYDSWSALFAILITGIGTLITIYAGSYFQGKADTYRFLAYLLLFMTSMLGVVMAGDVLTLFIFWEGTSITSFLLVAYKYKDEKARYGAFRALFITGGGAIAMLLGLLWLSSIVGSTQFVDILNSGDLLRSSEFYTPILLLIALGTFSKSAQFPFHIWLPGAMSAPTPASAYLHSATMVKAGIYLMARLNPALGFTDEWFFLLTIGGMATMLCGAYLGLKQNDLKALLAYSTIAQLGILMMLIGQEDAASYKALVIGIVAHALYKSALFMVAGIVDHETGTRDIRRLGGLRKTMPLAFVIALLAGLSMAGLPPMFGFLAKETLLAAVLHPTLAPIMTVVAVLTGALMLAQAGLYVLDTFTGKPRDSAIRAHEAPKTMLLAPAIPAAFSLIIAFFPGPKEEATFLAGAAQAAYGEPVKVSLALFHGLTAPLVLSLIAISLGMVIYYFRQPIRAWQETVSPDLSFNKIYAWTLSGFDKAGYGATRMQQGKLRTYLLIILLAVVVLVFAFMGQPNMDLTTLTWPDASLGGELYILRFFSLLVAVGAAAATVWLRRDFNAILAMGAMGLAVAILFVLEPAPDVALVQIVVDILSLVILVLALAKLPRKQRRKAQGLTETLLKESRGSQLRDVLVSIAIGFLVMVLTFTALQSRPRESDLADYFTQNAKSLTGATDIVGAVVVDFRALDTLLEITVFSLAGLGIYTLLSHAAKKHGDVPERNEPIRQQVWHTSGVSGSRSSPFIRVPTYIMLPIALVFAMTHIMYGHDQPGDGFTAGVIIGLAVALWFVIFGYEKTREMLPWLRPSWLISIGVLLAIVNGFVAIAFSGSFLGNVNYGDLLQLPLPSGLYLSSSFILEIAISLAVLGSVVHMLASLGGHSDEQVEQKRVEVGD